MPRAVGQLFLPGSLRGHLQRCGVATSGLSKLPHIAWEKLNFRETGNCKQYNTYGSRDFQQSHWNTIAGH